MNIYNKDTGGDEGLVMRGLTVERFWGFERFVLFPVFIYMGEMSLYKCQSS
jgi:hypothetical protein